MQNKKEVRTREGFLGLIYKNLSSFVLLGKPTLRTSFTHGSHGSLFTHEDLKRSRAKKRTEHVEDFRFGLLTLGGHGDDGLRRGVVLLLHPRVVLVQELRQRRRFGQQLPDHVPADVGSLLEPQDAEDLGLDAVEPHLLAVLPEVAGRALLSALRQQLGGLVHLHGGARREEDGQAEEDEHPGEKKRSVQ